MVCRSGFSSKIWFIWYIECPIWTISNFVSPAVGEYLVFYGLIRTGTNMGYLFLKSTEGDAPDNIYISPILCNVPYDRNHPLISPYDLTSQFPYPGYCHNIAMWCVGISTHIIMWVHGLVGTRLPESTPAN
jgi:hypothetical protein